jgi:putative heme-binding domain-containing protein
VATLRNDNLLWRSHAQRLLVERGKRDVVPDLIKLTQDRSTDAIGLNAAAIHALWTLHGLGTLDGSDAVATAAAVAALAHPSAGVRRAAVQVLPQNADSLKAILAARVLTDADAQVRLAAFLALAELPGDEAAGAVVSALADPANNQDRYIPDAATCAAAAHAVPFLRALAAHKLDPAAEGKLAEVGTRVAEHYARGNPGGAVGALVVTLAGADPQAAAAILDGLSRGWPRTGAVKLDDPAEKALVKLMTSLPVASRATLASLARRWGSTAVERFGEKLAASLLETVRNPKETDESRTEAALQLIDLRKADAGAVRSLLETISARTSPELAAGLIVAVRRSEAPDAGAFLVNALPSLTPAARKGALGALLGRTEWVRALLGGLAQGKVALSELSPDQAQALASHPNAAIAAEARKLLARGGGLPDADRQKVIDELEPRVLTGGDPARGKQVFAQTCAKCHTHYGEGAKIGPDLTGMWVRPKRELLVDILDPSRSVEGNYRQYSVATNDGRVLVGLLASESKTAIQVLDAEGKTHTVQRADIDELVASKKSLMPDGFEKQLVPQALADVLEFLTQRGKYLPLDLRKVATIVSTKGMFYSKEATPERLIFPSWGPKTFHGVPFQLVDPREGTTPNVVLLYSPNGTLPPKMPRTVSLPVGAPAKAIHLLSGVSGWGYNGQAVFKPTVSLIVRLHYADGKTEDHPLLNGVHFADYIRRVDVPESEFAFDLAGRQIRYLAVRPQRSEPIARLELVKGPDRTAPVVMAVTVESP